MYADIMHISIIIGNFINSRFWMMPALFLKKMVMGSFEKGLVDANIADSVDFLVDKVSCLPE